MGLQIELTGIVVIVGNYGSGKSEVSINLAVSRKTDGCRVQLADLDLVNPYFRSREASDTLTRLGVDVVLPPKQYLYADLPILSPAVAGLIKNPKDLAVLDVGGDDVGATVLSALADAFKGKTPHVLQVVNPYRPFTETVEGCLKMRDEIQQASKLAITGFIGNANLIDETTTEHIRHGYEFVRQLSDETGLPLEFITVPQRLFPEIEMEPFDCPVLTIRRQLVPPWKNPAKSIFESSLLQTGKNPK